MSTNIYHVLSAALTGTSELFLLCAVGAFLCHKEILTRQVCRQISRAILNAFLPALLFGSILRTVNSLKQMKGQDFLVLAPPMCAILVLVLGLFMGWAIMQLFGQGLHPMVKRACVMCVCFGNSNTMPILILRALCESFTPLEEAAGSVELCKAKTTGFVSLYCVIWSTFDWGFGLRYLIGWNEKGTNTETVEGGGLSKDVEIQDMEERLHLTMAEEGEGEEEPVIRCVEHKSEKAAPKPPGFLTPPVISVLLALALGYTPKAADILLKSSGPLHALEMTMRMLGNIAVPMSSLIVGAKLFASHSSRGTSEPTNPQIGFRVIAAVVTARMVLLPALGAITYILLRSYLPTGDKIMHTILLAEFNTPSASNNIVMAQIASIYRPDVGSSVETTVASLIFWQYVVTPFLLTMNTTINLSAVFGVASETLVRLSGG
eukprot:Plantae.Rhodophyta-Hildenbrandia_rubra.ctg41810.p1 GENE.Plantae.Rhodophyta-Hildenbrandia_rubra.ctg41810~~Plantae.Rhodophyta-Hildenbrandia_rubra.ctg41810.p1  ORF type:complete len:433 (+),score=56.26 Plantae.Rhodophyta-Hildenbrandia_rubra.ctg41810:134-1432(+)